MHKKRLVLGKPKDLIGSSLPSMTDARRVTKGGRKLLKKYRV